MKPIKNINKYALTKDELIEEIVKLKKRTSTIRNGK